MHTVSDLSWSRRGISLLWGGEALSKIVSPANVISIQQFFATAREWPETLPAMDGDALVVAGFDATLDALSPQEATTWLEEDLRPRVLNFQDEYQGGAGLIFWVPPGRKRIQMILATELYTWTCGGPHSNIELPLGRILWAGAEADVRRILESGHAHPDPDGSAWIGLNHPRIS